MDESLLGPGSLILFAVVLLVSGIVLTIGRLEEMDLVRAGGDPVQGTEVQQPVSKHLLTPPMGPPPGPLPPFSSMYPQEATNLWNRLEASRCMPQLSPRPMLADRRYTLPPPNPPAVYYTRPDIRVSMDRINWHMAFARAHGRWPSAHEEEVFGMFGTVSSSR